MRKIQHVFFIQTSDANILVHMFHLIFVCLFVSDINNVKEKLLFSPEIVSTSVIVPFFLLSVFCPHRRLCCVPVLHLPVALGLFHPDKQRVNVTQQAD